MNSGPYFGTARPGWNKEITTKEIMIPNGGTMVPPFWKAIAKQPCAAARIV